MQIDGVNIAEMQGGRRIIGDRVDLNKAMPSAHRGMACSNACGWQVLVSPQEIAVSLKHSIPVICVPCAEQLRYEAEN